MALHHSGVHFPHLCKSLRKLIISFIRLDSQGLVLSTIKVIIDFNQLPITYTFP